MNTNSKGQIVIPQEYRETLGITPEIFLNITLEKAGLFIQPVQKILPKTTSESMYAQVLAKTAGSWNNDNFGSTQHKRTEIELKASKERKKLW